MATSPIYGFELPDDTDLVKDGALAMRTLGDDVDSTLGTALNSKLHAGLVLVKAQTIGSGVSSVTVTNAFNATYDAYKIIITGGAGSTSADLTLKLGASTTGYYQGYIGNNYNATPNSGGNSNVGSFQLGGYMTTDGLLFDIDLLSPFLAKNTIISSFYNTTSFWLVSGGRHNVSTSYSDFIITPTAGTITGGTIAVYGYAKD